MHYFSLLPGSKIIIDEGGTLKIGKDQSLYVYDADRWGGYTSSTGKKFVPVRYAPSKTYTRTEADLVDAEILVNGTLDASSGKIYTTESGANIHSTGLDKTICSVCKKDLNKPVEVPALGHAEVTHEGKEPTYTEKGYETYHSRSRCDWCEEIVYIPVLGETSSESMDYVFSYKEYTSTGIYVSLKNTAENDLSGTVVLAAYDSTASS